MVKTATAIRIKTKTPNTHQMQNIRSNNLHHLADQTRTKIVKAQDQAIAQTTNIALHHPNSQHKVDHKKINQIKGTMVQIINGLLHGHRNGVI